jgi:hypothetical protein
MSVIECFHRLCSHHTSPISSAQYFGIRVYEGQGGEYVHLVCLSADSSKLSLVSIEQQGMSVLRIVDTPPTIDELFLTIGQLAQY